MNPKQAIKEYCLRCSNDQPEEVLNCTIKDCPLYSYRGILPENPKKPATGKLGAITGILALFVILFGSPAYSDVIDDIIPYVIKVESNGNPNAVSPQGCIGLMQINPKGTLAEWNEHKGYFPCKLPFQVGGTYVMKETACWTLAPQYTPKQLFLYEINLKIGEWYLRRLKDHYLKDNYTLERLLASYNGGITRMRRLLREGKDWQDMPRESVNYVRKVMRLYKESR